MNFSNIIFWLILITVVLGFYFVKVTYYLLTKKNMPILIDKFFLLSASLICLGVASIESLFIFILVSILSYFFSYLVLKNTFQIKPLSFFAKFLFIFILLTPLLYYKYKFFILEIFGITTIQPANFIIPVGISFYTFQVVGFLIDTYKSNQKLPSILDYLNFCSFVPQIVAGPIERRENLLPQVTHFKLNISFENFVTGLKYIILGLFFKICLADNLALCLIENINKNVFALWLNNIIFGLRIYFDFAGYGLSAYGLAICFGIKITLNFLSPYTATNIAVFWRRWNISLTNWFRDYIYIPIGGNRKKFWAINLMIVFFISGLWHGASWNFLFWGVISSIGLIIHKFLKKYTHLSLNIFISYFFTMLFVFYTWMYFYETNIASLLEYNLILFNYHNYSINHIKELILNETFRPQLILMSGVLPFSLIVLIIESISNKYKSSPYELMCSLPFICLAIFMLFHFIPRITNDFIYFAF